MNWPNWSSDNRVEVFDPSDNLIISICDPVNCETTTANTSYVASFNVGCYADGNNYYIIATDAFGDAWNGAGSNVTITTGGANALVYDLTDCCNSGQVFFTVSGGGTCPTDDAGILAISSPTTDCQLSASEQATVTIINQGSTAITSCPVVYRINGGAQQSAGTFTGNIAVGGSSTFNFNINVGSIGAYDLEVWTMLSGDANANNDSSSTSFNHLGLVSSFPYNESFESGTGNWFSGGVNNSWERGTPNDAGINGAADGTQAWVTNLTGDYNVNEQSFVRSPCFDFSQMDSPEVELEVFWNSEFSWDGAALQSSTDGGQTWTHVGSNGDPDNWYNDGTVNGMDYLGNQDGWSGTTGNNGSGGWVTARHDLTGLAGQGSVQFRIAFGSDDIVTGEGFAFDNITIRDQVTTWIGNTTSWTTSTNWTSGVPTASTNAIIPTSPSGGNMPLLSTTGEVQDLTIQSGASLTTGTAGVLNVSGNWSNSGTYAPGNGVIVFSGTAAQTITGSN
ncbi:MAG: hypothetical protein AAGB22_10695, partial [Bacteroidota bacterium]